MVIVHLQVLFHGLQHRPDQLLVLARTSGLAVRERVRLAGVVVERGLGALAVGLTLSLVGPTLLPALF